MTLSTRMSCGKVIGRLNRIASCIEVMLSSFVPELINYIQILILWSAMTNLYFLMIKLDLKPRKD